MTEILLVEDKDSLRQMLRMTLENAGYTVDEARDGAEARRKLQDARYKLVITDLKMPRADGLEVLRAAKASDASTAVILLTAYGTVDEAVLAMKEGAFEFLQKPVDSGHLLALVERVLEEARMRAENVLLREERRITRLGGSADIEVEVRVVAATNRDLKGAVAAKQFREDLYFRLAVFPVQIPALRDRRSDVRQIAEFFATKYGRELRRAPLRLTEPAIRALEEYDWPGKVRELENCIERACILSRGLEITPVDLNIAPPADYSPRGELALLDGFDLRGSLSEVSARAQRLVERRKIDQTLRECDFNKSRAAERLAVSYKTLLTRIKELELE